MKRDEYYTYVQGNITQTEQIIFKTMYVCTHMYVKTMNEHRGHKFERDRGQVYGRIWKVKRNWGKDMIIF